MRPHNEAGITACVARLASVRGSAIRMDIVDIFGSRSWPSLLQALCRLQPWFLSDGSYRLAANFRNMCRELPTLVVRTQPTNRPGGGRRNGSRTQRVGSARCTCAKSRELRLLLRGELGVQREKLRRRARHRTGGSVDKAASVHFRIAIAHGEGGSSKHPYISQ